MRACLRLLLPISLTVLLFACAERPKAHQPQPEEAAKAQVQRITTALIGAKLSGDDARVTAYFAPTWTLLSGFEPGRRMRAEDAPAWLAERLPGGDHAEDWFRFVPEGSIRVYSRYDLRESERKKAEIAAGYRRYLRKVNFLQDDDLLALVHLAEGDRAPLAFVFVRLDGEWSVGLAGVADRGDPPGDRH